VTIRTCLATLRPILSSIPARTIIRPPAAGSRNCQIGRNNTSGVICDCRRVTVATLGLTDARWYRGRSRGFSLKGELLARIGAARHAVAPNSARVRGALDRAASGRRSTLSAEYGHLVCAGLLPRNTGCTDLERTSRRLGWHRGRFCAQVLG
jgi:hypothetical protein